MRFKITMGVTALLAASTLPLAAQPPADDGDAPRSTEARRGSALLDEVVVTARKRADGEAAQSTPVSLTAYGADQFAAVFASNIEDIGRLSPGVNLRPSSQIGAQNFTIRGMGVSGTTPSDEPAVGVVQDGIYWGVNAGALLDTFDIESIEILRGPQGTLFGRNVTGGAVLVRSARPTGDFGFKLDATLGNYGQRTLAGSVEGSLVEGLLAGKLAVHSSDFRGYFHNVETGLPYGGQDAQIIRGTLVATPTDALEATLILERYTQQGAGIAAVGIENPANLPTQNGFRQPRKLWNIHADNPGQSDIEVNSAVLEVNWDVGPGVFTAITGVRDVDVRNFGDFDGTAYHGFNQSILMDQDQFSAELRYAGRLTDRISLTTGAYYFQQEFFAAEGRSLDQMTTVTATQAHLEQDSVALFAEADFEIADAWTLTVGARWTEETKKARTAPFSAAAGICPGGNIYDLGACNFAFGTPGKTTWDDVSPRAVLRFIPADGHTAYASVTRGFRSGGYSMRGNVLLSPFDEEEVTAYEVGYKADLLDRRLRVNTAVYSNKYKDLQRTVLGVDPVFGVVQSTFNVADATINGFEIDFIAQLTDRLVLSGGYGLTDASYDTAISGFAVNNEFTRVPEHTAFLSAIYDVDLARGDGLSFRVSGNYTGAQYFDDLNNIEEPGYTLLDASVTYRDPSGHWKVSLFGKNLANEEYAYWGSTLGALGDNRFVGAPRTWGLRLSYEY